MTKREPKVGDIVRVTNIGGFIHTGVYRIIGRSKNCSSIIFIFLIHYDKEFLEKRTKSKLTTQVLDERDLINYTEVDLKYLGYCVLRTSYYDTIEVIEPKRRCLICHQ